MTPVSLEISVKWLCEGVSEPRREEKRGLVKNRNVCVRRSDAQVEKRNNEMKKHFPVRGEGTACRRKHTRAGVGVKVRPKQYQP